MQQQFWLCHFSYGFDKIITYCISRIKNKTTNVFGVTKLLNERTGFRRRVTQYKSFQNATYYNITLHDNFTHHFEMLLRLKSDTIYWIRKMSSVPVSRTWHLTSITNNHAIKKSGSRRYEEFADEKTCLIVNSKALQWLTIQ